MELGQGVKIIAEVGSNWQTFEHCKDSIMQAKNCGADAVKFQLYDHKALYGLAGNPFEQYSDIYLAGTMPTDWLPRLKDKANACGIEFMCSAFSPELIDVVDPFVNIHKVASAEITHVRMLQKLAKIGKPVILSTGASGTQDIANALEILKPCQVTILYCVSAYPARYVNFQRLEYLKKTFGDKYLYGFSDHTTDSAVVPLEAVNRGACVIEKHVNFYDLDTPDAPHALNAYEFLAMCKAIRGEPIEGLQFGEQEMYTKHNRRLIATRDIKRGDKLVEGVNFGIYRSLQVDTEALSPWLIDEVNGRIAQVDVPMGKGIGPKVIA